MMKKLIPLFPIVFTLTNCGPAPIGSEVAIQQPAVQAIASDATAALDVVNTAPFVGDDWAYRPEEAAVYLRRRLYFELVESGHLKRIVDPGEAADLNMTVTITAFEHETPSVSTELHEEGKDGRSEMLTEVVLTDQESGTSVTKYLVSAEYVAGDNPIAAEGMLDEAVKGILGGFGQVAGANVSLLTE